jgi:signal transduction histidine kinase
MPSSTARFLRDAAVFAPCYILLDWASYIDPVGPFNLTPWNPQPALAIAWMLLGGMRHAPAVLATIFAADFLVRGAPGGLAITALSSVTLAGGYAAVAWLLQSLLRERTLRSTRDLTLFATVVFGGTAIIGAAFVGALRGAGLLGEEQVLAGWLRFWIGDAVGILVTAPLLLAVADRERRAALAALARRPEAAAQAALIVTCVWLIFYVLPGDPAHHFYILFVPLLWAAARGGMSGAILATALVQLGVVLGIHQIGAGTLPVIELQALVAALTLTGLYLGMMVDERSRATESLRHTLRLAAAGEMAGAIAHEVNQPLTAAANYGEAALLLHAAGRQAELRDTVGRMLAETRRASEIVRRLRDFFRTGTTHLERLTAEELLAAVRGVGEEVAAGRDARLEVGGDAGLPAVFVDRLQIELVIRNLIANAVEALPASAERRVSVQARRESGEQLRLVFEDSGPGIAEGMGERVFDPFVSGKPTGLGLGLAISRAIAEAHGGSLEARPGRHGEFHLVLPCAPAA